MKYYLSIIIAVFLVASCGQSEKQRIAQGEALPDSIRYATGFRIIRSDTYTTVEIINPWDTAQLLQRYLLVGQDIPLPDPLPKGTVLRIPLQNVAVYTAIHASFIDLLGETGRITGVCEPQYMALPAIHAKLKTGEITDLGVATAPNVEKIIDIDTRYIIASPFQNTSYGQVEKLGIPIIEGADYMEHHPLGRTEWIRLFGLLFDKAEQADSIFRETEKQYHSLKALAETVAGKPTVVSEKLYGSFWWMAGKESYVAHLFKDAGADYIFQDMPGGGSAPLAFETVLDKAMHADYWLLKYNQAEEMTYKSLREEYTPYEHFEAYKEKRIYTCNTGKVLYYEESPIRPDYLLKDLIRIFHPELLPDHSLRYYREMK